MSAFIVISTAENLNWIVDGIEKCRPHNPAVETYIAKGKLTTKGDGSVYYERNFVSESDCTKESEEKTSQLHEMIANQIAQFRRATLLQTQVQIFVLDNPYDEESLQRTKYVYDEINIAIKSRHENDYMITRVLFSYDVTKPTDVCTQVPKEVLLWHLRSANDNEFMTQICYLDNQDRYGAAIALSKEAHDIMIPRMLCDFMMLMSNDNSAYNIRNAASVAFSDLKVFTLGYSECMYYYPDVKSYFELSYHKDIRLRMLNDKNDEELLDYEHAPIGIADRVKRLYPIYLDVPFSEDIDSFPNSVDKKIDEILVSLRLYICRIKEIEMEKARLKDEEATEIAREEAIQEGRDDAETIIITKEQDQVNRKYPDYIDRHSIYQTWQIEGGADKKFDEVDVCVSKRKHYEWLLSFIQDREFKSFLVNPEKDSDILAANAPNHSDLEDNPGCNFFSRIFGRFIKPQASEKNSQEAKESSSSCATGQLLDSINSIPALIILKNKYKDLCDFEERLKSDIQLDYEKQQSFSLTSHCSSYNTLIDLQRMKEYQAQFSSSHMDEIIKAWYSDVEERNIRRLYQLSEFECERELSAYTYIHWDDCVPFVKKDIDITRVSKELKKRAVPLVNTQTAQAQRENLTHYSYYTDRQEWKDKCDIDVFVLPTDCMLEVSSHIDSKYAMIQILHWDQNILEGLTDIHTIPSAPRLETSIDVDSTSPTDDSIVDVEYEEVGDESHLNSITEDEENGIIDWGEK